MKMCRWACGHTLRDHVRNKNIKERLKVESIAERCRKARLRCFGHVKRRDQDYVGRQTLEMVPPGRRKRGRPKQRWMDCVNRDMRAIGTTKDEVHDRTGWRRIVSAAATPQPLRLEDEEEYTYEHEGIINVVGTTYPSLLSLYGPNKRSFLFNPLTILISSAVS